MRRKAFLIGFILLLLVSIPATVFLVKRQQELRSKAAPATTISFDPATKTVSVGQSFSLNVMLDTGENSVATAEVHLTFDPNKLTATEIKLGSFLPYGLVEPTPNNTTGTALIAVAASLGAPLQKSNGLQSVAVITFKAKAETGTVPTTVGFSQETVAWGGPAKGEEEVPNLILASSLANVARITVSAAVLSPTPTPTLPPGVTPTPTPTLPPGVTPTPTPLAQNKPPSCTSLSVSPATGNTPLTVTLTANAADQDNDILSSQFTFGDGQVQTIDKNIGQSGSFQVSHVYTAIGNLSAQATVKDREQATSSPCTAALTIAAAGAAPPAQPLGGGVTPAAQPTAAPTIPVTADVTPTTILGIAGAALTIIGALLFFTL